MKGFKRKEHLNLHFVIHSGVKTEVSSDDFFFSNSKSQKSQNMKWLNLVLILNIRA